MKNELLLGVYKKAVRIRQFETCVYNAVKNGVVKYPVYLGRGQELIPATLSGMLKGYMLFTQHRAHGIYIAMGGDLYKLRDELLGLETGCSFGKVGSNCLQIHENGITMYGHHGLVGENVSIGVGAALASGKKTVCFFGDGGAEEDYVISSIGFAITHKLPVLFVCEDNNKSVLTPKSVRRSWSITDVAKGFGLSTVYCNDDVCSIYKHSKKLLQKLPALINIETLRYDWHVGAGTDEIERDRLSDFRVTLVDATSDDLVSKIDTEAKEEMELLWKL